MSIPNTWEVRTNIEPWATCFDITPDDSNDLWTKVRAIYCWGDWNIKVDCVISWTVTFNWVVAWSILPIQAKRVYSTGTTWTNLIWIY
jgi:hypothetical protein